MADPTPIVHPTMANEPRSESRWSVLAGSVCLLACLALLSTGVRTVRAADPEPTPSGSDLVGELPGSPAASPGGFVSIHDDEAVRRPGVAGVETSPGVIVLNTRGFNYGPPPSDLDAAALRVESRSPARDTAPERAE